VISLISLAAQVFFINGLFYFLVNAYGVLLSSLLLEEAQVLSFDC
jgi:hypothetical protein